MRDSKFPRSAIAVAFGCMAVVLFSLSLTIGCNPPRPQPQPTPDPTPNPTPEPTPGYSIVVLYDAKAADDLAPYADPALDQYAASHGLALRIVASDVVDESGKTPKYLAPYIQAAAGKPLPVVLLGKAGTVKQILETPADSQAVIAWIEKTVGENPDLAANGFWAGGAWRMLGSVKPMRPGAAAKWPAEGSDQAEPLIPLEKIKEVSLAAYAGRSADQGSSSSCCPTSACSLLELMGERSGLKPVKLSAADLYCRIANGDNGSMLDDAWAQLTQVGVCTTDYCVEQGWYRKPPLKPGYQLSRAKNRALRVTYCQDFGSIASALNRMKPVHYGLFVDNGFSPNSEGVIGEKRRRGGGGHAVLAVGLRQIGGQWYVLTENSWGDRWGGSKDGSVPKGMALIHHSYADEGAVFGAFAVSSIVSPSDDPIVRNTPPARKGTPAALDSAGTERLGNHAGVQMESVGGDTNQTSPPALAETRTVGALKSPPAREGAMKAAGGVLFGNAL